MKVFAISDLHLSFSNDKPMFVFGDIWNEHWIKISKDWDEKVEENDIVLIAGDISWARTLNEAQKDIFEISKRPGIKIFVRGNHDYWCSSSTGLAKIRIALPSGMHIIRHDAIKIQNLVICGTRGWTVPDRGEKLTDSDKKIYDREVLRLRMSLESAKKVMVQGDKLIAMIHFPPFNSSYDESDFTKLLHEYNVNSVIYGHLHGKTSKATLYLKINGIEYYLTSCDLRNNLLTEIV